MTDIEKNQRPQNGDINPNDSKEIRVYYAGEKHAAQKRTNLEKLLLLLVGALLTTCVAILILFLNRKYVWFPIKVTSRFLCQRERWISM